MVADCGTWILTSPGLPGIRQDPVYGTFFTFIIYTFNFPRYFFEAIIMQLCALLSYAPYFLQTPIVELSYVAFANLFIAAITTIDLILTLYHNIRKRAAIQASS